MSAIAKTTKPTKAELDALAARWLELKDRERELRDERWALEEQLADRVGRTQEGKVTAPGNEFTLELEFRIRRSLNKQVWERIRDSIPPELRPVRWTAQLDTRRYFDLVRTEPATAELVERAIELRPSKVGVRVRHRGGLK